MSPKFIPAVRNADHMSPPASRSSITKLTASSLTLATPTGEFGPEFGLR